MKKQSHKSILYELGVLLTLLALAVLWVPAPRSMAQQENRQLKREQTQPNGASARRLALVIGNGAYTAAPPLKNPPNDARDMAATLRVLGFEVTSGINVNQRDMKRLIREFGQKLKAGGSGLFYYAGHGVQSKGRNYLIPVEADIKSEADVEDVAVDVNLMLGYMDDAQNGLNIVILDACRNNPFARSFRSAGTGLAQVDAPTGTLIAYATAPGRVASDGTARNGLYTGELLRQMRETGLGIEGVFKRVRANIQRQTNGQQVPWESSSLVGDFYFGGSGLSAGKDANSSGVNAVEESANRAALDPTAIELSFWESIKNSSDPEDFNSYLEKYPNGQFASLARNRIVSLKASTKPTQTKSATDGSATELAFWDSIKNSSDPEDFKDYLSKYPGGQFNGLAQRRLAVLAKPAGGNPDSTSGPSNASSAKPAPEPGPVVKNQMGMELVFIPPGSFEMGSNNGRESEKPVHLVTIGQGFYIGKFEVTQSQWQAVMGKNPSKFKGCGGNCPVENLLWNDAQDFINKLNEASDGYSYRLPSEAEWEYACRGGTTGDYYDANVDGIGWYSENSGKKTHAVGGKRANAFGLYDMSGNVWEWCNDWWHDDYVGATTDGRAWLNDGKQQYRVVRGGSWYVNATYLRSASRDFGTLVKRYDGNVGFRVVAVVRTQ